MEMHWSLIWQVTFVGSVATALIDVAAWARGRWMGVPGPNWGLVARWVLGLFQGRLMLGAGEKKMPPRGFETALGWMFHYAVGGGASLRSVGHSWRRMASGSCPWPVAWLRSIDGGLALLPVAARNGFGICRPQDSLSVARSIEQSDHAWSFWVWSVFGQCAIAGDFSPLTKGREEVRSDHEPCPQGQFQLGAGHNVTSSNRRYS